MRVLAIGLDAAEPTLVQQLIDGNELPALKRLLAQGSWSVVKSPAHIGSGAVWPTFITGTDPVIHGIYGEWCWHPETMSLSRYHGRHLSPFWKDLLSDCASVGLLDVPFAPLLGLSNGFEISEWGAHDTLEGRTTFSPASLASILDQMDAHPYTVSHVEVDQSADLATLRSVNAGSLKGVKLRGKLARRLLTELKPDLAIVVFPEIHHSAHYNWHTLARGNPIYDKSAPRSFPQVEPTLIDIYREVDRQIGALLEIVGEKTSVFVFSLHGMRPTLGIVTFLEQLMCELGFARVAGWSTQSWKDRARSLLAAVKRRTPDTLKRLYYQTMPKQTTYLLAQPTMMPAYDWSHTRAFAMQTDQHGRIRLNLRGREARGIVPPEEYEGICVELEGLLRRLRSEDGSFLVHDVIRPAKTSAAALELRLPDLIIHWRDAAFKPALKIEGIAIDARPSSLKYTGQHALDGFCITARHRAGQVEKIIPGNDLHRLLLQNCKLSKSHHGPS